MLHGGSNQSASQSQQLSSQSQSSTHQFTDSLSPQTVASSIDSPLWLHCCCRATVYSLRLSVRPCLSTQTSRQVIVWALRLSQGPSLLTQTITRVIVWALKVSEESVMQPTFTVSNLLIEHCDLLSVSSEQNKLFILIRLYCCKNSMVYFLLYCY